MRILVVATDFAPEAIGIAPYNTQLAKHFVVSGHEVTVLTTFPHYPNYRWHSKPPGRTAVEVFDGVAVRRAWSLLPKQPSAAWRIAFDTSFAVAMRLNARELPAQDLVLAIFPPAQGAIVAGALARKWKSRLIIHIQDLPVQAALTVGMLKPGPVAKAGRYVERVALRSADTIVAIDQGFVPYLEGLGLPTSRVRVIPNWIDLEVVKPMAPDPGARALLGALDGQFLLVHAGNLGRKQALTYAANAIATFGDGVRLGVIGEGSQADELAAMAAGGAAPNLTLLPLQPATALPALLSSADALLLSQRKEVIDSVVPSKLLTYMASGRPVIAAVHPSSTAARIVRDSGCGLLVLPEDAKALADAVRTLSADRGRGERLGRRGREYAVKHFDREVILANWDKLLQD